MFIYRYYMLWSCSFILLGCSSFKKTTVSLSSGLLYDASFAFQRELDWHHLKESMPGTLKMLEGLHSINPHNKNLTAALIKGYAGYAFAIWETLALKDALSEKKKSQALKKALQFYSRAIDYGLDFFATKGVAYKNLQIAVGQEQGIAKLLDTEFDRGDRADREAVLYLALSLGSLIHLQKTNIALMAQLPIVKGIFDWVCQNNPNLHYGTCGIFYGSYEAGHSKNARWKPRERKENFRTAYQRKWRQLASPGCLYPILCHSYGGQAGVFGTKKGTGKCGSYCGEGKNMASRKNPTHRLQGKKHKDISSHCHRAF